MYLLPAGRKQFQEPMWFTEKVQEHFNLTVYLVAFSWNTKCLSALINEVQRLKRKVLSEQLIELNLY